MLIVTASDNNYVAGVVALIGSVIAFNKDARFVVLDMNISEENRQLLDQYFKEACVEVSRYEVDDERFSSIKTSTEYIKTSTYMRLLIPELLPQENRAIYMDCDMLCVGNLDALNKVDVSDCYVAGVYDLASNLGAYDLKALDFEETGTLYGQYINAGLLVMNLDAWRRDDIAAQAFEIAASGRVLKDDQSAINILCKNHIAYLDLSYNFMNSCLGNEDVKNGLDVRVIHYTGKFKPWMENVSVPLQNVWNKVVSPIQQKTPIKLIGDSKSIFNKRIDRKSLLSRANKARRMYLKSIFGSDYDRKLYKIWKRSKVNQKVIGQEILDRLA